MTSTLVTTTQQGDLYPLACQGLLVHEHAYQLTELIRNRLSPEHALLFAEPMVDHSRQVIDWYSAAQGPVRPLAELSAPLQADIRATVAARAADIKKLAAALRDHSPHALSGDLLALSVLYPDDAHIYMVGEQPVITCWGFGPATTGATAQDLTRLGPEAQRATPPEAQRATPPEAPAPGGPVASPSPDTPCAPSTPTSSWSWAWLLPLLLLLLLLALLFSPLRTHVFAWLMPLPQPQTQTQPLDPAPSDDELALLQGRLAERAALCLPPEKPAPKQPNPLEQLVLPNEKEAGMTFLEGLWRCDSDLEDASGKALVVEYRFDKAGKGYVSIWNDAQKCIADAHARMQEGALIIDTPETISCPSGSGWSGQNIRCTSSGSQTVCTGTNKTQQDMEWNASFYKIDTAH